MFRRELLSVGSFSLVLFRFNINCMKISEIVVRCSSAYTLMYSIRSLSSVIFTLPLCMTTPPATKSHYLSFRLVRNLSPVLKKDSRQAGMTTTRLRSSLMVNSLFIMKILCNATVFNAFPSFKCNFIATNKSMHHKPVF